MTTCLGIDPGLVRLGLGVVSIKKDGVLEIGQGGVIAHPKTDQGYNDYVNAGIWQIAEHFPQILHTARPDFVVAEIVPVNRIGSNSESVVAAITVCKVICWQWGIEWHDLGANTVKKAVTGDGLASKAVVRNAIIALFPSIGKQHEFEKASQKSDGIQKPTGLPQDVFDAVSVAVTGAVMFGGGTLDDSR